MLRQLLPEPPRMAAYAMRRGNVAAAVALGTRNVEPARPIELPQRYRVGVAPEKNR